MKPFQPRCWLLCVVAVISIDAFGNWSDATETVDYSRDVQPVLRAKCFRCHGPDQQEGGLRLDVRQHALAGGDSGVAIVPGRSDQSELVRRVVSTSNDDRMPPEGERLTVGEIDQLRAWINQGARGIPPSRVAAAANHWAFQQLKRPATPTVTDTAWPRNAIDRFVLNKLETRGIKPSGEAGRETLIRRLHLDLIGLPPPWRRVRQFVEDARPDAYNRLVDELLASPHYGERWGRHWLDLARYADSTGYESDQPRAMWAYRDWVIQALNSDMPFDQFVTEQLAGDLLPGATLAQRIATGFHCNAMFDPGVRHEAVIDRVNTTGAVFLGLTTGCAQCHSHKTDPLTHREFYQLYAFYNEATIAELDLASDERELAAPPARVAAGTGAGESATRAAPPKAFVMQQTPQPTHLFLRGDRSNPGDKVTTGFPAFLKVSSPSRATNGTQLTRLDLARWLLAADNPLTARVTANRLWQRFFGVGLVETEADFGVQTPEPMHRQLLDYLAVELHGATRQREPADVSSSRAGSTPAWQGLKSLHRLIVTSATYRQASDARPELAEVDGGRHLLARQQCIRLEAELIRDVSLAAGGLLCNKLGGPSVFPHQAAGILQNRATPATWKMSAGEDRYRRGLYTWVWRLTPHPNLPLFDAPDGVTACTRRGRSNIPVQALTLLNDPTFVEASRALAARLVTSSASSDAEQIQLLWRTCVSRDATSDELRLLRNLLAHQRLVLTDNIPAATQIAGDLPPPDADVADFAAWVVVCRVVMNLDEFITRE